MLSERVATIWDQSLVSITLFDEGEGDLLLIFACLVAFIHHEFIIVNFKDYQLVFVQVVPYILHAQA